jgi:AMMECR1 domain-containing protein
VGKHGIIIRKGFSSGLLLPQVAVEHGMDRNQFLEAGCRKAGITDGRGAEIWVFEAKVFRETEPNGPVVEKDLNR